MLERDDGTNGNNGTNGKIRENFRLFRYFRLFRHLFFLTSPQNLVLSEIFYLVRHRLN
jgi:hypothetical protein